MNQSFNELDMARIEEDDVFSSETKTIHSKRSSKSIPADLNESFDFRSRISDMIEEEESHREPRGNLSSLTLTPSNMKKNKEEREGYYTKTMTIRGKKGYLYK